MSSHNVCSLQSITVSCVALVILIAIILPCHIDAQSFHFSSGWGGAGKKRSQPSLTGPHSDMDSNGNLVKHRNSIPTLLENMFLHNSRGRSNDLNLLLEQRCQIKPEVEDLINKLIQVEKKRLREECWNNILPSQYNFRGTIADWLQEKSDVDNMEQ